MVPDDVIGGHVRGPKFENLFFSYSWINFRKCHTNSIKDKNYFFTVLFQIEIVVSTCCPPKLNRVNYLKIQLL